MSKNCFNNIISKLDMIHFLLRNECIFSLRNEIKITNPDKAIDHFGMYYCDIRTNYKNIEKQEFFAREIEHRYLIIFFMENGIQVIDYEIKTKVKALYVSVYIQRTIELHEREHGFNADGDSKYFLMMKAAMLEMIENQPDIIDANGVTLEKFQTQGDEDIASLTRFYTAIKEAQRWQTHAKWEKFAFYVASMAVGEGVWYCPGGAAKPETLRRKHLFSIIEKIDNKYNKCVKKRKTPMMTPMSAMIPPGASGGLNSDALNFGFSGSCKGLIPAASASSRPAQCVNSAARTVPSSILYMSCPIVTASSNIEQVTVPPASDSESFLYRTIPLSTPLSDPLAVLAKVAAEYESHHQDNANNMYELSNNNPTIMNCKASRLSSKALGAMGFNPLLLYPYLPGPKNYTSLLDTVSVDISNLGDD